MSRTSLYRGAVVAMLLTGFALVLGSVDAQTRSARRLTLRNMTGTAVEYGLGGVAAPPGTSVVLQPGATTTLFPVPGRDVLYSRYRNVQVWTGRHDIPFGNGALRWNFVPSGAVPGVSPAP